MSDEPLSKPPPSAEYLHSLEHGASPAVAQPAERLPISGPALIGNELEYVRQCLESTWISSRGELVEAFEERYAALCGVEHAVAVNTGTAALHVALVALGVAPGDEVI